MEILLFISLYKCYENGLSISNLLNTFISSFAALDRCTKADTITHFEQLMASVIVMKTLTKKNYSKL